MYRASFIIMVLREEGDNNTPSPSVSRLVPQRCSDFYVVAAGSLQENTVEEPSLAYEDDWAGVDVFFSLVHMNCPCAERY